MVFFNYSTMQLAAKIVYCGPGLSGKTTNLEWVFGHTAPHIRGEMVTLATDTDRTVFFDLLPLELGHLAGFKTRLQLYTVPGQVFYNSTRKLVLRGVDGLVFVADSQRDMHHANLESLRNLQENIAEMDMDFDDIPLVLQYNKRDLDDTMRVEEMNQWYNLQRCPWNEATATLGIGVFETLKSISKLTLTAIKKRLVQRNLEARTGPLLAATRGSTVSDQNLPPIVAKPRPIAVSKQDSPTRPPTAAAPPKPANPTPPVKPKPPTKPDLDRLRKKLKLALKQETFHRTRQVNVSLTLADEDEKPIAVFRNIRLMVENPHELQRLLLELKVLIKPKP